MNNKHRQNQHIEPLLTINQTIAHACKDVIHAHHISLRILDSLVWTLSKPTPTLGGCYQSGSQPIVEGPNDPTEGGFHNFVFFPFVHVQILG
jgi:hypothetical protein